MNRCRTLGLLLLAICLSPASGSIASSRLTFPLKDSHRPTSLLEERPGGMPTQSGASVDTVAPRPSPIVFDPPARASEAIASPRTAGEDSRESPVAAAPRSSTPPRMDLSPRVEEAPIEGLGTEAGYVAPSRVDPVGNLQAPQLSAREAVRGGPTRSAAEPIHSGQSQASTGAETARSRFGNAPAASPASSEPASAPVAAPVKERAEPAPVTGSTSPNASPETVGVSRLGQPDPAVSKSQPQAANGSTDPGAARGAVPTSPSQDVKEPASGLRVAPVPPPGGGAPREAAQGLSPTVVGNGTADTTSQLDLAAKGTSGTPTPNVLASLAVLSLGLVNPSVPTDATQRDPLAKLTDESETSPTSGKGLSLAATSAGVSATTALPESSLTTIEGPSAPIPLSPVQLADPELTPTSPGGVRVEGIPTILPSSIPEPSMLTFAPIAVLLLARHARRRRNLLKLERPATPPRN